MSISGKLLAATLLAAAASSVHALDASEVFEKVAPSVWALRALDEQEKPIATGSAVVVAPGRLVTSCRLLARSRSVQVRRDNVSYLATLEYPDTERDLCQLAVTNLNASPVAIGALSNVKIGQRTYVIGSPRGVELSISEGIVSSIRENAGAVALIQTSAQAARGFQGGGLFDSEGRLIGITAFPPKDAINLHFATPAEWIRELPERGAAALAKYSEEKRATPGPEATQQLSAQEMRELFQPGRRYRASLGGGTMDLEFSGDYVRITSDAFSGQRVMSSPLDFSRVADAVCLRFMITNASTGGRWKMLDGCYRAIKRGGQYGLQSTEASNFEIMFGG